MNNKKEQMKKLVEVARRNLVGDISAKSKRSFDEAVKLDIEDIKKVNDELHDRVYYLLGRILVHTQFGKFVMQHVMDHACGDIMPGAEKMVDEDTDEMIKKIEESIGYGCALIDKQLEEQADGLISQILGYDREKTKCCKHKCTGECKKPARDEKGRFIKKKCNKKASCKTTKNKKHDNVSWF